MSQESYQKLMKLYQEFEMLGSINGVLNWDTETQIPSNEKITNYRAKQYAYLESLVHDKWQNPEIQQYVSQLQSDDNLDLIEKRNIELIHRELLIRTKIPKDLVVKLSSQSKRTDQTWKKAKQKKDFSLVLSDMKDLFELNKQRGEIIGDLLGVDDPYESLIQTRDPGFTVDKISNLFEEMRTHLVPMIDKLTNKEDFTEIENIKLDKRTKAKIATEICNVYGYKADGKVNAFIGEVEHPLTIGCGPYDSRVTVKYEQWEKVIFSACHEVGHAIHRLGKDDAHDGTPINNYGSPSVGEMNSRYTENKIGKSRAFWEYFYPQMQKIASPSFDNIDLDTFYRFINRVEPGPKRMKADELTYGLHIIIRFELERDLFAEKISLDDINIIWKERYEKYLGVTPKDDTEGVMQDLHWYNVYWGYFQGYALGDLMGSQVHYSMEQANPNWEQELMNGNSGPVLDYFKEQIFSKGFMYDPMELVEKATGSSFSSDHLTRYLKTKYAY
ncbi:MAG: carboxypeptidase M32 [Candidatus Heimdallarchaeota archaeon]|nr:carboxypeptidase M32 [Candidatus Heimdallarchaeota archaeon]